MELQVTAENLPQMVEDLKRVKVALPEKDHGFVDSLIKQFTERQKLSEKQMLWVGKMIMKGLTGALPGESAEVDVPQEQMIPNFQALFGLFKNAGSKLKYPKLTFEHKESGHKLVLRLAGEFSSAKGTLQMIDPSVPGYAGWLGRLNLDGTFKWNKATESKRREKLVRFLTKLALNPEKTIQEYGHLTGHCCFCHSGLTDEKSLTAGYGPVCAKNWGLPWGNK